MKMDISKTEVFFCNQSFGAGDVWTDIPTTIGIVVYSVLTPSICFCGIVGNFICLVVLIRNEFFCSFYVYLRVLSVVDLTACAVIFISGLARGIFWWRNGWAAYDALISIPLGGFLSCMSTIATVFVTIDRLVYLKNPLRRYKPKFCRRKTAVKIMCYGAAISILCTLPYCFIYEFCENGFDLQVTRFYKSRFYAFFNWFDLTLFAITPFGMLLIGNTMLFFSIKHARSIQKQSEFLKGRIRKIRDQSKITATLIAIVFFYLIGEVPTHLTARKTAANLLFGGDDQKADCSLALEICRQVTTVLNALHLAIKFILYCYFCPPFFKALKATITSRPSKERQFEATQKQIEARNVPVKIFLVDCSTSTNSKFKVDLNQLGFMNMFINTKAAQELPKMI